MSDRSFMLYGNEVVAKRVEPALYLAATPIGNLSDITLRVLETLAAADIIACEDTRVSAKLLRHFGINTKTVSYHEHNAGKSGTHLLDDLKNGKSVVQISDAGTPLVSDPGFDLVTKAKQAGIRVVPLPGASAPLAALVASGLPTGHWQFLGFPPAKTNQREAFFKNLTFNKGTLIFFESPNRLANTLNEMRAIFGKDRLACVARELTKMHETIFTDTLGNLHEEFSNKTIKGEIVILVAEETGKEDHDPKALLTELLKEMPIGKAAAQASEMTGLSKRDLYQLALSLKDQS